MYKASDSNIIEVQGIRKSYGNLQVLKGIDFSVKRGEVVSLVGRSGSGKSTLLHIMGTLDKADSGKVSINGTAIAGMGDKLLSQFRNKHIGFVFQFHHLLPEFTAMENVSIPSFLAGTSEKKAKAEAQKWLERLGLGHRLEHKPSELSGGEQQRVAVARALINNPDVVLADEPSGNLDTQNSRELHQLFFDLRNETGQTFLIVTHNEELATLADRRVSMADGLIV
jgi:lipoprotein-releasing system ATP-binding protein